jgi:hypothetical protein
MKRTGNSVMKQSIVLKDIIVKSINGKDVEVLLEPIEIDDLDIKMSIKLGFVIFCNNIEENIVFPNIEKIFEKYKIMKHSKYDLPYIKIDKSEFAIKMELYNDYENIPIEIFENTFINEEESVVNFDFIDKNISKIFYLINSITFYFYPIVINNLNDVINCYDMMDKIQSDFINLLINKGSMKHIIFSSDIDQANKLVDCIMDSIKSDNLIYNDYIYKGVKGIQLSKLTVLNLIKIVDSLKKCFKGEI